MFFVVYAFNFRCKTISEIAGQAMVNTTILYVDCDSTLQYICLMKHISILALNDATITSIDSSYQILNRVNDFLKYQGKAPFYTVEIVGLEKNITLNHGLYSINVNSTIHEIEK